MYTKTFKCTYQLQLYPFDTQVSTAVWGEGGGRVTSFEKPDYEMVNTFNIQVCTVNLIVRLLETSVMELTPNNLMMESETVLTQYLITNW